MLAQPHPRTRSKPRHSALPPSDQLGPYRLIRRLGVGGMAEVWLARHTCMADIERDVVIKRVLPHLAYDPRFVQMLFNEARLAARINHPNVAHVYDVGEDGGTHYLTMEYVPGVNLLQLMDRCRARDQWIRPELAMRIIAECCKGLAYAHAECDIIHRDVTPSNIIVSVDGAVKLVDFGIAKAASQASMTDPGMLKGKYAYMSPEQANGRRLDHRSDIFTLGLVLYELLTGVRPLEREGEMPTLRAAAVSEIHPPSTTKRCSPELDALVMKALSKDVDERYANAREFQMELEQALVGRGRLASSVHLSQEVLRLFPEHLPEGVEPPTAEISLAEFVSDSDRVELDEELPTAEQRSPLFAEPREKPELSPRRKTQRARQPAAPRKFLRLSYAAGGGAVLALVVMLVAATRTSASPLDAVLEPKVELRKIATTEEIGVEDLDSHSGLITVATSPATTVYVGDMAVGKTPILSLRLGAGPRQLRLVNEDAHIDRLVTIDVRAGEISELHVTW